MSRIELRSQVARDLLRREDIKAEARHESKPSRTSAPALMLVSASDAMPAPVAVGGPVVMHDVPGAAPTAFLSLAKPAAGAEAQELRLAVPVEPDEQIDVSAEAQGRLAGLEMLAAHVDGSGVSTRADRVRQGMLLVLHDSQSAQDAEASVVGIREQVASALVEGDGFERKMDAARSALIGSRSQFHVGMDIHALVQAVLRESYMLQNEILHDHYLRMDGINEMRKALRKQLDAARDLKRRVAAGEPLPATLPIVDPETGNDADYLAGSGGAPGDTGSSQTAGGLEVDGSGQEQTETGGARALPEGVRDEFAPAQALVCPLGEVVRELRALRATGGSWVDMYNTILAPAMRDDDSLLADDVAQLTNGEVGMLLQTLISGGIKSWPAVEAMLAIRTVIEKATASQLNHFVKGYPNFTKALSAAYPELGARLGARAAEFAIAYEQAEKLVPSAIRNNSELASPMRHYLEWKLAPNDNEAKAQAWAVLMRDMWALSGDAASRFIDFVHEDGAVDSDGLGELFLACSPEQLEATGPEAWAWTGELPSTSVVRTTYEAWLTQPISEDVTQTAPPASDDAAGSSGSTSESTGTTGSDSGSPIEMAAEAQKQNLAIVDDYIAKLESNLQTAGGDAELAQLDLQNALQKQQQLISMMSNISKMLHDTAMSIIRKIGG